MKPPESASTHRYQRQRLFAPLGPDGDDRLRASSVLVVGCGALGSRVAVELCRAGIGALRLLDRDTVEWSNLHRQVTFTEEDARTGVPKAAALARHLGEANSQARLEPVVADFNADNARELARGVDLILDGTDNLPTRFLINDLSLALAVPWVYGGAVGDEAHAQIFVPPAGPCLRCIVPVLPPAGSLPTCDTAGVIGPAPAAAASFQSALALRYLSTAPGRDGRRGPSELAGLWVRLSLWTPAATVSRVVPDPRCPACRLGERRFLDGATGPGSQILCGRRAVQISPASGRIFSGLDLASIARRLSGSGAVEENAFLVRFRPAAAAEHRITLFRDGRAIVEGTTDEALARTLYDRYVGQ